MKNTEIYLFPQQMCIRDRAAVGVTIEGKTNIQTLLHNKLLQTLNMRRTGVVVDAVSYTHLFFFLLFNFTF